jgi:FemAB-related protein (PEP-CTERM system-associated)
MTRNPLLVQPFEDGAAWDSLVSELGGGTYAHLWGWREVMRGALGHESWAWSAVDGGGRVQGILPLVRVRSRLFGDYLVSMPFINYGGPLGTPEAREALGAHAREEARRLGVDLLELRSRTPVPGDLVRSDRKVTVLKELPETSEELWEKGLKAKLRSQVRRPMKEGMSASFGPELLGDFYDIFAVTMRDLGTPVLPRSFFESILMHLGEHAVICVVAHEGRPAAAGFGFAMGDALEITWAGALRELSRKAPNMLLYWAMMEESIRRRVAFFDFGRCTPGSGTHRFKRQWGGEDHPLPWAVWSASGVAATPTPTGRKMELATRAWSRLPVGVTRVLGPRLSRSIP